MTDDDTLARLARHRQLLETYHAFPLEELLADLMMLTSIAAAKARGPLSRQQVLEEVRAAVRTGAGHDCQDWRTPRDTCAVCDRALDPVS